jgi:hypothetical protein
MQSWRLAVGSSSITRIVISGLAALAMTATLGWVMAGCGSDDAVIDFINADASPPRLGLATLDAGRD